MLAAVRDLREVRAPATTEELADFELDVLASFVLARTAAGVTDSTVRRDTGHLDLIRGWFARPAGCAAPGASHSITWSRMDPAVNAAASMAAHRDGDTALLRTMLDGLVDRPQSITRHGRGAPRQRRP